MPSFATFSPGLPNNVPATVLPVFVVTVGILKEISGAEMTTYTDLYLSIRINPYYGSQSIIRNKSVKIKNPKCPVIVTNNILN